MSPSAANLLVVALAAVVAPLLAAAAPAALAPPVVVLELLAGIVIGPVLHLVSVDPPLALLSQLGLAFLFLLAGMELDLARLKGRPLTLGVLGWGVSLVVASAVVGGASIAGLSLPVPYVTLALCTTALGTLLPIWRDAGILDSALGRRAMAVGACGELLPIVVMSVLLTGQAGSAASALALVAFVLIALACVVAALRVRPRPAVDLLARSMHVSSQLPVRVTVLALAALVALARELGLDVILGAFAAGMLVGLAVPRDDREGAFTYKLDALGFGLLIPVFFVVSGMSFDLDALLADPASLALVPLFMILLLVVRGTPALLLYRHDLPLRERIALALYSASSLPLIVAISALAVAHGAMSTATAAAMVTAGMLSVLVFPVAARMALGVPKRPRAERAITTPAAAVAATGDR